MQVINIHNKENKRIIFHIDVNSAFLSWTAVRLINEGQKLDIRTVPAIIGGDSEKRHGIVLAKSIPASKLGIKTAEPIASALRKCPDLIIESSDHELYSYNSKLLMEHLSDFCPDIEQVSVDECYMDFTPIMYNYTSPEECAYKIKDSVKERFGFTVNVGISNRKVLAKMASDFEKPDKVHTLFDYEIKEKMWPLPVGDLYMCGKRSQEQLNKLGIITIGDLATFNIDILTDNLKSQGKMLHDFANGIDNSWVNLTHERAKGIGNSTTLSHDLTNKEEVYDTLIYLADKVSSRLRNDNRKALQISLEIKYSSFKSVSQQLTLERATSTQSVIYQSACSLFEKLWNGEPVRLLGIRSTKLVDNDEPYQMNIFDFTDTNSNQTDKKEEKLDAVIDTIRGKYGSSAITKGYIKKSDS